jgi:hypothetical protein
VPPLEDTRVPKVSVHVPGLTVAYRNQAVVTLPPGFAEPLRLADESVTDPAAEVVTEGAAANA